MHLTAILYLTLRVKFVFACVFSISTFTRLAKFTPFVLYMHHSLVNLTVKSALKSTDFWLKLAPFFMAHGVFFSCRKCQNYWRCPSNMVLKLRCIKVRKLLLSRPHTHTHTRLTALLSGLPGWAGTRKVKPIWILLKQETVSSSGISRAIRKSAPHSREITTPTPHRSVFTGRMPILPPNQQRQSTEGKTPQDQWLPNFYKFQIWSDSSENVTQQLSRSIEILTACKNSKELRIFGL